MGMQDDPRASAGGADGGVRDAATVAPADAAADATGVADRSDAVDAGGAIGGDGRLSRDAAGRLVYVNAGGAVHVGVVPVRPFPLSAPGQSGLSLLDAHGREVRWIEAGTPIDAAAQALIDAALAEREFRPRVARIRAVSTFTTPSIWSVDTDRGPFDFTLRGEEDIRRLDGGRLLVTGSDGIAFEIADRFALDRGSRKLLERFL